MTQTIPETYFVTLEDVAKRIGQGDLSLAAQVWRSYPADVGRVHRVPHGDAQKMLAENLLYRCYEAAVKLLAATAERLGIDSTAIVQASRDTVNDLPVDEQTTILAAGQTIDRLLLRADMAETEPPKTATPQGAAVVPGKEDLALAILARHPEWSDTRVAKEAGCSRTSLYRFERYMKARELLEQGRMNTLRGSKSKDGDVEAWDEDEDE